MRFFSVTPRIVIGENSSVSDMVHFLGLADLVSLAGRSLGRTEDIRA
jgi:hypothetical protein